MGSKSAQQVFFVLKIRLCVSGLSVTKELKFYPSAFLFP